MSRKMLTISYVGTNYCGWQVQKNGLSVQECVCKAFFELYGQSINIPGCSRTDSGVHATNYCLHFDDTKNIDNLKIVRALNVYLPDDISAISCVDVANDFHARYSCKEKTYKYKIYVGERNPFLHNRAYRYYKDIDIEKINNFAKDLLGTHDFSAFCSAGSSVEDKVRTLKEAYASEENGIITFTFAADGFLYNMVRILSGTFLAVNEGKITENDGLKILESKSRELAGNTLPAHGLYLDNIKY